MAEIPEDEAEIPEDESREAFLTSVRNLASQLEIKLEDMIRRNCQGDENRIQDERNRVMKQIQDEVTRIKAFNS